MQKALDGFFKTVETIVAILLFSLTAVAFYQLLSRYILSKSNAGVDEVVRLAFVWVASFGSALAFRAKSHLGITALVNKLTVNNRRYAHVMIDIILIVFFTLVTIAGIRMALMGAKQYSEYLRMSMVYFYACIPTGAVISILSFIEDIEHLIKEIRTNSVHTDPKEAV